MVDDPHRRRFYTRVSSGGGVGVRVRIAEEGTGQAGGRPSECFYPVVFLSTLTIDVVRTQSTVAAHVGHFMVSVKGVLSTVIEVAL